MAIIRIGSGGSLTVANGGSVAVAGGGAGPTPTVPGAPTLDSLTQGDAKLTVNFTAGSDGGSAITNYAYSLDGGNNWTLANVTASPFDITDLTNNTIYYVMIRAVNAIGDSAASNMLYSAPAIAGVPTPNFYRNNVLTGVSGQLRVWPNFFNNTASITSYEVSVDGGSTWASAEPLYPYSDIVNTAAAFEFTGLTDYVSYPIQVRATNAFGTGAPVTTAFTNSGTIAVDVWTPTPTSTVFVNNGGVGLDLTVYNGGTLPAKNNGDGAGGGLMYAGLGADTFLPAPFVTGVSASIGSASVFWHAYPQWGGGYTEISFDSNVPGNVITITTETDTMSFTLT